MKYIVVKKEDVKNYLTNSEQEYFDFLLKKISDRKGKENFYYVVNKDEPFAEKVWEMIKNSLDKEKEV